MTEPLTEDEIDRLSRSDRAGQGIVTVMERRLLATLRAEQEARQRAEGQRDRLAEAVKALIGGVRLGMGPAMVTLTEKVCVALREIEGGER